MPASKLVFIHLPKTAGTTVREILRHQYGPDAICGIYDGDPGFISQEAFAALTPDERDRYRVYCGHFSYGLHQQITAESHYYAMFRDPVERIVSYYHHAMRHAPMFKGRPVSLMKFLDRKDWQIDNLYTRMISGEAAAFGKCTDAMLAQAIDNVARRFVCVGLQNKFDASIALLAIRLQWEESPAYEPLNVGAGRPSLDYFSNRELDRIRELNELDMRLYGKIKEIFDADRMSTAYAVARPDAEVA